MKTPGIFHPIKTTFTQDDASLTSDQRLLKAYAEFSDSEVRELIASTRRHDVEARAKRLRLLELHRS